VKATKRESAAKTKKAKRSKPPTRMAKNRWYQEVSLRARIKALVVRI